MSPQARDQLWSFGSAALIVIGSLGPWATFGPFSASGTSGDGVLTLILGLVAGALVWTARWPWALLAVGVIAAGIGVYDTLNVSSSGNELVDPSPGWGVIVTALAGVSLCVWAWRQASGRSAKPADDVPSSGL